VSQPILDLLGIDENTYNDMVIDLGFAYIATNPITNTTEFWLIWWRSWLEADEAELDLGQVKDGQTETYITTQLMAYELTYKS